MFTYTNISGIIEDFVTSGLKAETSTFYFMCWTTALSGGVCLIAVLFTRFILSKLEIKDLAKRTVFITGCDCGFGNILAKSLDAKGVRVVAGCLTGNGADTLRNETSSRLRTVVVDITKKEDVERAYDFVKENLGSEGLWGVVNNAGIMPSFCPAEWISMDTFVKTCNVNLFGTVSVTLKFLPLLRMTGGRLVNVCSVTSNCPYPGIIDYSVSKGAVKSFSISLRRELLHTGVTIHTIEPGGYNTNIPNSQRLMDVFLNAYKQASPEAQEYYGGNISKYLIKGITLHFKFLNMRLHDVTDAMTHALFAKYPKRSYPVGLDTKLFFGMLRLVPESVADYILSWPRPYGEKPRKLRELNNTDY